MKFLRINEARLYRRISPATSLTFIAFDHSQVVNPFLALRGEPYSLAHAVHGSEIHALTKRTDLFPLFAHFLTRLSSPFPPLTFPRPGEDNMTKALATLATIKMSKHARLCISLLCIFCRSQELCTLIACQLLLNHLAYLCLYSALFPPKLRRLDRRKNH